jgi:deoxycytidine triphosphate deaminase
VLLTAQELEDRLDVLFEPDTSHASQVRGTKYELRLSDTYLIGPGEKPVFYTPKRPLETALVLPPGGVAYVSTEERFTMPWDVVARTGVKYALVRRGVNALVGSTVDPGYGRGSLNGAGPGGAGVEGEPLYFLLTNFSSRDARLEIGESILTVEFEDFANPIEEPQRTRLEGALQRNRETRTAIEQGVDLRLGLSFISDLRSVEARFSGIESWVERILVLGLLVVLSALLALFSDLLIHALESDEFSRALDHAHLLWEKPASTLVVAIVGLGPVVALAAVLWWVVRHWLRRRGDRRALRALG